MFTDVNENDGKAAMKIWGQTVAQERHVPVDPETAVLKGDAHVLAALSGKQVDAVVFTIAEYARLRQVVSFGTILLTQVSGCATDQYVLLAHRDGPIKSLADLRGRSIEVYANHRACIAPLWLNYSLIKEGFGSAEQVGVKLAPEAKLSKVVLPVFFRQADACLVTRGGFENMGELNPQVTNKLAVLCESPKLVPCLMAFRADYNPPFKQTLITGLNELDRTPAGQQMLTIFRSDKLLEQPESVLEPTLKLFAEYSRLCDGTNSVPPAREISPPISRKDSDL